MIENKKWLQICPKTAKPSTSFTSFHDKFPANGKKRNRKTECDLIKFLDVHFFLSFRL